MSREMDRETMRMAILNQERTFRQQLQELHRVYHVQKQLMREMQIAGPSRAPAIAGDVYTETKPPVLRDDHDSRNHLQPHSFSSRDAPASADDCNLELTLATGSSSGNGRGMKGKQAKYSSNSDSGVSSMSTESEPAVQFKEPDAAAVRFQRLAGELSQPPWLHQRLSLKMA